MPELDRRISKLEDRRSKLQREIDRDRRRKKKVARKLVPLKERAEKIKLVNEHLGPHGEAIVSEAHAADLSLALACALVEQESLGKNIFGCDLGARDSVPYCHQGVTRARIVALLSHLRAGGTGNGVGLTQLTSSGFVFDAEESGGAEKPEAQCEVGFDLLVGLIGANGKSVGIARYNGSGPQADAYSKEVQAKEAVWRSRLD